MNPTTGIIMIASINPVALSALRIAGALFIAINLLAGAYLFRRRRQLFGRDPQVEQDTEAVRHARVAVVLIPWLFVTAVLFVEWLGLWSN
jgi:predicted small integral membrane protein